MADIVGIGILNIDYIIKKSLVKSDITTSGPGHTVHVPPEKITGIIDSVGLNNFQVSPGGSSFNTIYAISSMDTGISVGYIGIAGKEEHGCDFQRIFKENNIDDNYVKYDASKSNGKCISFTGRERSLVISSPISDDYEDFLQTNKNGIIDYLGNTKIVHISAIPTGKSPEIIYSIVVEAKKKNPGLLVSIDPGIAFLHERDPSLEKWISISNYLFLNYREFRESGQTGEDSKIAKEIFTRIQEMVPSSIIVKKCNAIIIYERLNHRIFRKKYRHLPLPSVFIKDDTGAGDVFSGGFLCAQLLPVFRTDEMLAVQLSQKLVLRKFRAYGNRNYREFHDVYIEFLENLPVRVHDNFTGFLIQRKGYILITIISLVIGYLLAKILPFF